MIIDAESEFYTKATARELAVAANRAGCAFVGARWWKEPPPSITT